MLDDASNPKATPLQPGAGLAYEHGQAVPVAWPEDVEDAEAIHQDAADAMAIRVETLRELLDLLLAISTDATDLGRKTILLAYQLKIPTAPQSLAELGIRLGVSKTRAHQLVELFEMPKLNAENFDIARENAENEASD